MKRKVKYIYANGGELLQQLLPAAMSLIPGGGAVGALMGPIFSQLMQPEQVAPPQPINYSKNPYGMQNGGPIVPMPIETTFVNPTSYLISFHRSHLICFRIRTSLRSILIRKIW